MKKKSDNKKNDENNIADIPVCRECGAILTDKNWYASYKKTPNYICKKCEIKRAKKWNQNNRDRYNQSQREGCQCLRDEVIDAYGGKCACCGETRREYLTIDHKNGNGNKQRKEMGFHNSYDLYRWLKQNNYPEEFQVLCFNCNLGKRNFSVCPHDKEVFEKEFEAKLKESSYARCAWALRMNVIDGYGGKCEFCGEDNPHFLTIDHINGRGAKDRKMIGGSYKFYKKLRDENYPRDNYRLLCYNCNCALGFGRIKSEDVIKNKKLFNGE